MRECSLMDLAPLGETSPTHAQQLPDGVLKTRANRSGHFRVHRIRGRTKQRAFIQLALLFGFMKPESIDSARAAIEGHPMIPRFEQLHRLVLFCPRLMRST